MAGTKCAIGEEQCGFRQSRGCMDQVFAARQVCEKYLANGKMYFGRFMDLEKAYDTIVSACAYRYDRIGVRIQIRYARYVADAKSVEFEENCRKQCRVSM